MKTGVPSLKNVYIRLKVKNPDEREGICYYDNYFLLVSHSKVVVSFEFSDI